METKRICKKCLTRDLLEKDTYFKNLHDYIANLDEEIKAEKALYEERLSVCTECELLLEGMCRTCGCYVELRAALTKNNCPNNKW